MCLLAIKSLAYIFTGATVALIELLRSLGDLLNSVLAYTGTKLASRPYNSIEYPFGKGRYVYLFGFTTSILALGFIAAIGFIEGIATLIDPQIIENAIHGIAFLSIALVIDGATLALAYKDQREYIRFVGESNPLIRALIVENSMDVISESIAIAAIALACCNAYIDGIASLILSVILALYSFKLAKENVEILLGRSAPPHIVARAIKIALSNPAVMDVNNVKSLVVEPGSYLVIMELEFDPKLSLEEIDEISREIRNEIRRYVPSIRYIVLEPRITDGYRDSHKILLKAIAKLRK